jgi:Ca2+-transporting ATPase
MIEPAANAETAMARSGGLGAEEARRRLAQVGRNVTAEPRRRSVVVAFAHELTEPMIALLLVVGVLYAVWGELRDTITIFAVIVVLVGVEVGNERRAERAIAALDHLAAPGARVVRDGRVASIAAEEVVPGDLLLLEPGARVPADARLVEARGLAVDESALTGEPVPADKRATAEEGESTIFAGTVLVRGHGSAVVVATGPRTELGRLVSAAAEARPPRTPLQLAMRELARSLVWAALVLSVLVPLLGVTVGGAPIRSMILVGLALAFATIPEELPIILTMVLALGGYRLSKRRAIVKRLRAVETLGAVTFVATDKTGTLTENRMRVATIEPPDFAGRILEAAALASGRPTSDPTELAIFDALARSGAEPQRAAAADPVVGERSFDDERRTMSVVVGVPGARRLLVKGAPEAVLASSADRLTVRGVRGMDDGRRASLLETVASMAARGLRVLAVAERDLPPGEDVPEEDRLVFLGLLGLDDPPREGVTGAIRACHGAGIRVAMLTGDHPATAAAVARQVGLGDAEPVTGDDVERMDDDALIAAIGRATVFARISPAHKLRIVETARARGDLVAVTGDGINDAPALAAADVGIAMGQTGTDVAREAADIVLADDDFDTLVHAIGEGRVLFRNLRKGIRYYLACKLALIASMLVPAVLGIALPFAPVQIVLMELFMDLAASATFVAEPGERDTMRRPPPDRSRPFLDRAYVASIVAPGVGLFAAVTTAFLAVRASDPAAAGTTAFVAWLVGHFLLAVNLRSEHESLGSLGLWSNRPMLAWGGTVIVVVLVAVLVPGVHAPLRTVTLSPAQWGLALGTAIAGTMWIEGWRWIQRTRSSTG